MFLNIALNQLHGQLIISHILLCFSTHFTDIISSTSIKITQTFDLLLGFAENQIVIWDFKGTVHQYGSRAITLISLAVKS